ncbi:MAG: group III truncated hemoglobin [Bacteroidia bacterium]|nr:group III truncated hemoglobin [Bacteroidia bacterium]NNJ56675.1 group III truncated hemoglobin [Bacteroidia bacterium]
MAELRDIETREDILLIMREFYDKLLADESIAYIFTEVAKINLEEHFPVLVDFWDSILFGSGTYQNNAMKVHIDLAKKSPLTAQHFKTWLGYLFQSIEDNFEGLKAHTMKARAQNIAGLMEFKVQNV